MAKVLYLVRHTRTTMEKDICYGQTDVDVADNFERTSEQIKEKLSGVNFDRIYFSPLKRCYRLAKVLGSDIIADERLMEMDFGDWENKSWHDIYLLPEGKSWFADYIHTSCPNGESFTHLLKRVSSFMEMLDGTSQHNVLIVTHAGVIRAILVYLGLTVAEAAFDIPVAYGQLIKIENNCYKVQ